MRHRDVQVVPCSAPGAHTHPRRGSCLLELVSTLPAGREQGWVTVFVGISFRGCAASPSPRLRRVRQPGLCR